MLLRLGNPAAPRRSGLCRGSPRDAPCATQGSIEGRAIEGSARPIRRPAAHSRRRTRGDDRHHPRRVTPKRERGPAEPSFLRRRIRPDAAPAARGPRRRRAWRECLERFPAWMPRSSRARRLRPPGTPSSKRVFEVGRSRGRVCGPLRAGVCADITTLVRLRRWRSWSFDERGYRQDALHQREDRWSPREPDPLEARRAQPRRGRRLRCAASRIGSRTGRSPDAGESFVRAHSPHRPRRTFHGNTRGGYVQAGEPATWAAGDYAAVAEAVAPVLVERVGVAAGQVRDP